MPNQRQDHTCVLVVRAFVEGGSRRTLLVRVLEVNTSGPDRILAVTGSSRTASRAVRRWLELLVADARPDDGEVVDSTVTEIP